MFLGLEATDPLKTSEKKKIKSKADPLALKPKKKKPPSKRKRKKAHTCDQCGRVYDILNSLRNHKRFYCGVEARYGCDLCGVKFKRTNCLKRHKSGVHGSNELDYIILLLVFSG